MAAMSAMMQQHWSKGGASSDSAARYAARQLPETWLHAAVAYAYSNEEGEAALTPLNEEVCSSVVSSVKPGSSLRILDTACGHGEPACTLASLLPQAEVRATALCKELCTAINSVVACRPSLPHGVSVRDIV